MEEEFKKLESLLAEGFIQKQEYDDRMRDLLTGVLQQPINQQREILGTRLYRTIEITNPGKAAKISGMLLEGRTSEELIDRLLDSTLLESEIQEAIKLINQISPSTDNQYDKILELPIEKQKNELGNHLYKIIQNQHPDLAPKLTGMLLDGRTSEELVQRLKSPAFLQEDIDEAVRVLTEYLGNNQ